MAHHAKLQAQHQPALHDADVYGSSAFNRTYYWGQPNGTRYCDAAEALCQGLWPQGAWGQVTFSSKQQQLDMESYYTPKGVNGWVHAQTSSVARV